MSKEIKLKKDWLTVDEKKIVRAQFFPTDASDLEMQYCMNVAKSLGLNPILKQIFFVPRRQKVGDEWVTKIEPMVGRDSYLHIAHRGGEFETIESSVKVVEKPILKNDNWIMENDLSATAIVYRKNKKPTEVTVYFSEYIQVKKDGTPTKFWEKKPLTMLKKVAESQALRKAFNITGLYDESEIEKPDTAKIQSEKKIKEYANQEIEEAQVIKEDSDHVINKAQAKQLDKMMKGNELTEAEIQEAIKEQDVEAETKNKPGF